MRLLIELIHLGTKPVAKYSTVEQRRTQCGGTVKVGIIVYNSIPK